MGFWWQQKGETSPTDQVRSCRFCNWSIWQKRSACAPASPVLPGGSPWRIPALGGDAKSPPSLLKQRTCNTFLFSWVIFKVFPLFKKNMKLKEDVFVLRQIQVFQRTWSCRKKTTCDPRCEKALGWEVGWSRFTRTTSGQFRGAGYPGLGCCCWVVVQSFIFYFFPAQNKKV